MNQTDELWPSCEFDREMAGKFQPPDVMDFTNPAAWPQWKIPYERYAVVAELSKEDKDIQVLTLINCMGQQAEQIFNSFTFAAEGQRRPG